LSVRNIQPANYYFYALNRSAEHNIHVIQRSYYCFYKYDQNNLCGDHYKGRTEWPQIYLFLLSNNVTFAQRTAIISSVKIPMERHMTKVGSKKGKMNWNKF
jgi:hypothetical protein